MTTADYVPPLQGEWVKRESLPNGLDDAGHLNNIAYYQYGNWHRGLTSSPVQYWVRVDDGRDRQEPSHAA